MVLFVGLNQLRRRATAIRAWPSVGDLSFLEARSVVFEGPLLPRIAEAEFDRVYGYGHAEGEPVAAVEPV